MMNRAKEWFYHTCDNLRKPETLTALFIGVAGTLIANFIWVTIQPLNNQDIPMRQLTIYTDNSVALLKKNITSPDLVIKFKDNEIDQIFLYEFTFQNTGQETIDIIDFDSPLVVTAHNSVFLLADVTNCNNNILKKQIAEGILFDDGSFLIPKVMLNPNDFFTISFLMNGSTNFNINGRINGISNIIFNDRTKFAQFQAQRQKATKIAIAFSALCLLFIFLMIMLLFIIPYIKGLLLRKKLESEYKIVIPRKLTSQIGRYSKIIDKYKEDENILPFLKGEIHDDLLFHIVSSKITEMGNNRK